MSDGPRPTLPPQPERTDVAQQALERAFLQHVMFSQGKYPPLATAHDRWVALALTVRDRLVQRWIATQQHYRRADPRRVHYLSAEFLLGRATRSNLVNLGLWDAMVAATRDVGLDLGELLEEEPDAGLGNGGLGRLAACLLDSLATLGYPAYGYGLRYEFGIFDQVIADGFQVERPDVWLRFGNPWEIVRPEYTVSVGLYGRTESWVDERGNRRVRWVDTTRLMGIPYDTPIAGMASDTVNTLRLWRARAPEDLDLDVFNRGDFVGAVERRNRSENVTRVLYPSDASQAGRELRLEQQYFFVACTIHDIVRRYLQSHADFSEFAAKCVLQLNDTHPAIAVAELMRVLVDEHGLGWDEAWAVTRGSIAYTNHTLLSEALERWPISVFERMLPRHLQVIREIDRRFLQEVGERFPGDGERARRMAIVDEGHVRMAHLAVVGSHKVNGVAELHGELLVRDLFRDFHELDPARFTSVTNGITPRRWLIGCNPELSDLISDAIGDGWKRDLDGLEALVPFADDAEFRSRFRAAKLQAKRELAAHAAHAWDFTIDPAAMLDVQAKRIHEYKRQLLLAMYAIHAWQAWKDGGVPLAAPRTVIVAGKAAPAYAMAKLIIRLIHGIGEVVNPDAEKSGLRVLFVPNYRVTVAERLFPAADLSEQISLAGTEASGTGNMKLALNGALTIGTLDGANVEIRDAVGPENFFLFGLRTHEVAARRREGYVPRRVYEEDGRVRRVIDAIADGTFSRGQRDLFRPLVDSVLGWDPYLVLADFADYARSQRDVDAAWNDADGWARKAILNVARMGRFSSDRTVRDYAEQIWKTGTIAQQTANR